MRYELEKLLKSYTELVESSNPEKDLMIDMARTALDKRSNIYDALYKANYLHDDDHRILMKHHDHIIFEIKREKYVIDGLGFDDFVFCDCNGEEKHRISSSAMAPRWEVFEKETGKKV